MPVTTAQKNELASNVTFCCPLWHMQAVDGAIAAYAEGGDGVIVFDGKTFVPTPVQNGRPSVSVGLEPDKSDVRGVFDSFVTKVDVGAGRWAGATLYRQILVSYLDLSLGSVRKQKGKVGQIEPLGSSYKITFESQVSPLSQKIGDLTSNSDRIRVLEDLISDVSSFTHASTVTSFTNRRKFKVSYVAPNDTYFQNGRVVWLTGANAGKKLEIKSGIRTDGNTRTEIELHLQMASEIANGDTMQLIRGYKGTREDAKTIGNDAILNTQFEPDMPPESWLLKYPE